MIIGKRVILRSPNHHDADEFTKLNVQSRSFHRGFASPPKSLDEYSAFLARAGQQDSAVFLICRKQDSTIAGAINLSQIFRGGFQNAYLGYYIGASFANQEYMTEAIQLILRYAFRELKLHRIEANIQPANAASLALVRKAGFRSEGYSPRYLKIGGRWRDHERWAITVEDWRARTRTV
ncbi:MAG: phosphinothricin acetyltransferase [Acidobacteria bacterium]|nr:MAG: phosphinothricin acetyltransferase [Acidobacteriota bacterium]